MSSFESLVSIDGAKRKFPNVFGEAFVGVLLLSMMAVANANSVGNSKVTIYGLMDLGVELSRSGEGTRKRMISGGSAGNRLGFQGVEDLGGGLSVQFKLEQGFTAGDGQLAQGGRAFGREASLGLRSNRFGMISAGRIPIPYYVVLSGIDAFSWTGSGGMLSITQSGSNSRQLLPLAIFARADNSISYLSPNWGGLEWRLQGTFSEKTSTLGHLYSTSLRYRAGAWDAVAGWAKQNGANSQSGSVKSWTAGGNYNFGAFKLFAGIVNEKNNCTTCTGALTRSEGVTGDRSSEFRLTNMGVLVPLKAWDVFAQVVRIADKSQYQIDPGNRNATWLALGARYNLSKRTMVYGTIGTVGNKNGSNYALGSGTSQQPAKSVGENNPRASTAVIGLRHSF